MFAPDTLMLLLLATIVLLPLVPAYLLFHALGTTAQVDGPWQGLNIKLGGAFAGYFVVVLMVLGAYQLVKPQPAFQVWNVSGNITDAGGNDIGPISAEDFSASPPWLEPPTGGNFRMYVFTRPGNDPGTVEYPVIQIRHGENEYASFSLDPAMKNQPGQPDIQFDAAHKKVYIRKVSFTKVKPYNNNLQPIALAPAAPAGTGTTP